MDLIDFKRFCRVAGKKPSSFPHPHGGPACVAVHFRRFENEFKFIGTLVKTLSEYDMDFPDGEESRGGLDTIHELGEILEQSRLEGLGTGSVLSWPNLKWEDHDFDHEPLEGEDEEDY